MYVKEISPFEPGYVSDPCQSLWRFIQDPGAEHEKLMGVLRRLEAGLPCVLAGTVDRPPGWHYFVDPAHQRLRLYQKVIFEEDA